MKFTLEITGLGNAAFTEMAGSAGYELARILEKLAAQFKDTSDLLGEPLDQPLHDAYGNPVGRVTLK